MYESENVKDRHPAAYPYEAGVVYVSDGSFEITAAQNVDEAVVALCVLPIGCIPLDFVVIMDALDSGASLIWNGGGIIATTQDDVDQLMITGSQVGRVGAPGIVRAASLPIVAPLDVEVLFGVHFTAQTGGVAGTIRGILTYRANEWGG